MGVCHAEDRFRHPVDAKTPLYWSAEDANRRRKWRHIVSAASASEIQRWIGATPACVRRVRKILVRLGLL